MKKFVKYVVLIFLTVIVGGILLLYFRPDLTTDKQLVIPKVKVANSHFMNWKGGKVHYTTEGKGTKTMLMIHGFGGSFRNFDHIMPYFEDSFRIIRLDLPGFGLSDYPMEDTTSIIGNYTAFLHDFMDSLQIDSAIVVGNSMGGAVSWVLASAMPERVSQLVLLNSAGYNIAASANKMLVFKYKAVSDLFRKGLPLFMSENGLEKCYADDNKIDKTDAALNNSITNKKGNLDFMLLMASRKEFPDIAAVKNVKCPTLIIWGKEDEIIPYQYADSFERDIKGSKKIVYSPCGHVPMAEIPEQLSKDVFTFLNSSK